MLYSNFKIPGKSNNNNNNDSKDGTTTDTTQLNRSHWRKELNKFNSLDDGEEDMELTAIRKNRMKLLTFVLYTIWSVANYSLRNEGS